MGPTTTPPSPQWGATAPRCRGAHNSRQLPAHSSPLYHSPGTQPSSGTRSRRGPTRQPPQPQPTLRNSSRTRSPTTQPQTNRQWQPLRHSPNSRRTNYQQQAPPPSVHGTPLATTRRHTTRTRIHGTLMPPHWARPSSSSRSDEAFWTQGGQWEATTHRASTLRTQQGGQRSPCHLNTCGLPMSTNTATHYTCKRHRCSHRNHSTHLHKHGSSPDQARPQHRNHSPRRVRKYHPP